MSTTKRDKMLEDLKGMKPSIETRKTSEVKSAFMEPVIHNIQVEDMLLPPKRAGRTKKATYEIDAKLHKWFKDWCYHNDVDMKVMIEKMILRFKNEIETNKVEKAVNKNV